MKDNKCVAITLKCSNALSSRTVLCCTVVHHYNQQWRRRDRLQPDAVSITIGTAGEKYEA